MAVMFKEETKALIEAILFVAKEPLSLKVLKEVTGIDQADIKEVLQELMVQYYSKNGGFSLIEIAEGYQFTTKSEYAPYIERLYRPNVSAGLSKAALETLAIIAYKQPVTRGEIEIIRGVKIDSALSTLVEKKIIQEVGRKEGIGRPILFGTSPEFLKYFGLKSLEELPNPEELFSSENGQKLELE